jgi:putative ABC transport system substrate-binding protein
VDGDREKDMKKTITFLTLCAMLFALSFPSQAQQPTKIPRIGLLQLRVAATLTAPDPLADAFRQGLRELGYVEGKNILIEHRYEGLDGRLPDLVAELVQLKVDVIVVRALSAIHAAKQATKAIPIVILTNVDPVATGLIDSLARPGANITGISLLTRELSGKRLELLKEAVPKISRVGVLGAVDARATAAIGFKDYEAAARALKIQFLSLEVRRSNPDFAGAFQAAVKGRVSAIITISGSLTASYSKRIADLAIKNRLPSMSEGSHYVEAGHLVSYATDDAANFRRAAYFVDKILKGAKPADLPVEQPTKFEFVINLKTAKALNLTIPQSVLYRADKVIK